MEVLNGGAEAQSCKIFTDSLLDSVDQGEAKDGLIGSRQLLSSTNCTNMGIKGLPVLQPFNDDEQWKRLSMRLENRYGYGRIIPQHACWEW